MPRKRRTAFEVVVAEKASSKGTGLQETGNLLSERAKLSAKLLAEILHRDPRTQKVILERKFMCFNELYDVHNHQLTLTDDGNFASGFDEEYPIWWYVKTRKDSRHPDNAHLCSNASPKS